MMQALLTQLEDQATTCFASLDDTSNIQDIEEQLSEFEEVGFWFRPKHSLRLWLTTAATLIYR